MNDINIPAKRQGYLYTFAYPLMTLPLYLCTENDSDFKLTILDDDQISFNVSKGFNVFPIKAKSTINILCDKKIFNIYLSYSPSQPKQFY